EDGEEDDDDAILLVSSEGSPTPAQVELNLLEMCKRAAAKPSIDSQSQQAGQGTERNLYDGKRLQPQLFIPEMKHFWDKPFSHRVPVKGFSRLDVHNTEELGMLNTPHVEL
ncbi:hypothetical protein M9458_029190, partial [Cirrhinus mrigala]